MTVKNINEDGMYLASKAKQYTVLVDSRWVAEKLGKAHDKVLRDIRNLLIDGGFSKEFSLANFGESTYKNSRGKSYHYSNEADMVNRAALGMTAKQYKLKHGIPLEVKSIRDYLNAEEIERVDRAQAADVVLCRFYRDFKERQQKLMEYMGMRIGEDIIAIGNAEPED